MTERDALDAVWRAHMVTNALCLLTDEDLREPSVRVLLRQSLSQASAELAEAHDALASSLSAVAQPAQRDAPT